MKPAFALPVGIVCVLVFSGCGSQDADSLIKGSIKHWEEAAECIESIHDETSIQAADERLQIIVRKLQELNDKARSTDELSPEQMAELKYKNQEASRKALERLSAASKKALMIPGARDVVLGFNRAARAMEGSALRR